MYDSNELEGRPRKSWYTSTCSEYVQKECVDIWRNRPADLLKKVQGSEGQTTVQDAAEEYEIIYSKGDVVALKHNYKPVYHPLIFLAFLLKDLHNNRDAFLEDHMGLRRLEQSSLRNRRLEVVGERENGRARGRHAKGRLGTVTIEIRVGVSSGKFK